MRPVEPQHVRAAIYTRVSLDREGEGLAVARQERDCRALADDRGWQVVEVYTDNHVSATSRKPRPRYEEMCRAIEAGEIDAVICWDADRLTRKPREFEDWIDFANTYHLQLATVGGEFDLSLPGGRAMARMRGVLARWEVEQTSKRAKAKHLELARRGLPNGGGYRPYGFGPDRITHITHEADVIRRAADALLNGATLVATCRAMNDAGETTVLGKPWNSTSLRKCLLSARVAGLREYKGEHFPATWEPILPKADWDALRGHLGDPQRRVTTTAQRKYTWSGLLLCGKCWGRMSPRRIDGKLSYTCVKDARRSGCGRVSVRMAPLTEMLDELLLLRVEALDLSAAPITGSDSLRRLESEVHELTARLDDLEAEFVSGRLPATAYASAAKTLEDLRQSSLGQFRQENQRLAAQSSLTPHTSDLRTLWSEMSPTDRRKAAGAFIDSIAVLPVRVRGRNSFDPDRIVVQWRVAQE